MSALLENPIYQTVSVMRVDWDKYRDDEIVTKLDVPRRSTLVMFSGGKEVGRVVARTDSASIEVLFNAAL